MSDSTTNRTSDAVPVPAESRPRRGRGVPTGFVAAVVAVLLGVVGLVVGSRDSADQNGPGATAASPTAAAPVNGTTVGNLTVYDAYIRQPASPDVAAAYLTVRNSGDTADRLSSAYCGAGTTSVHADSAAMRPGDVAKSTPLPVPAGATVSLTPAKGHIMLDKLTGTLKAGDTVSLLLRFDQAGQVLLDVPVISITAPAPGGATS